MQKSSAARRFRKPQAGKVAAPLRRGLTAAESTSSKKLEEATQQLIPSGCIMSAVLFSWVGLPVRAQLSDGTWWRGHLSAADTEDRVGGIPGLSVSLSAARPEDSILGYREVVIPSEELCQIVVENADQSVEPSHTGHRRLERWSSDEPSVDMVLANDGKERGWDQFHLSPHSKTPLLESHYTTKLDTEHPEYAQRLSHANKLARLIESEARATVHMDNEEEQWAAVLDNQGVLSSKSTVSVSSTADLGIYSSTSSSKPEIAEDTLVRSSGGLHVVVPDVSDSSTDRSSSRSSKKLGGRQRSRRAKARARLHGDSDSERPMSGGVKKKSESRLSKSDWDQVLETLAPSTSGGSDSASAREMLSVLSDTACEVPFSDAMSPMEDQEGSAASGVEVECSVQLPSALAIADPKVKKIAREEDLSSDGKTSSHVARRMRNENITLRREVSLLERVKTSVEHELAATKITIKALQTQMERERREAAERIASEAADTVQLQMDVCAGLRRELEIARGENLEGVPLEQLAAAYILAKEAKRSLKVAAKAAAARAKQGQKERDKKAKKQGALSDEDSRGTSGAFILDVLTGKLRPDK